MMVFMDGKAFAFGLLAALLLLATGTSAQMAGLSAGLVHLYDDIDLFRSCSYYNVTDFDQAKEYKNDIFLISSKTVVRGYAGTGTVDYLQPSMCQQPMNEKVPSKLPECTPVFKSATYGNGTKFDNITGYDCKWVDGFNWTRKSVMVPCDKWLTPLDMMLKGSVALKGLKSVIVRFCAPVKRQWTAKGYELSVDLIPKLEDKTYDKLNWWNSSWSRCRNLDINVSAINGNGNSTNIVLPLRLDNSTGVYNLSSDWSDIRIVNQTCDGTGGASLAYQLENYSETYAYLHVLFPVITSSPGYNYSVFWGNPSQSRDMANPYNASYVLVAHFNGSSNDTSLYGWDSTFIDSPEYVSGGKIDTALNFSNDAVSFADNKGVYDGTKTVTFMAWVYRYAWDDTNSVIAESDNSGGTCGVFMGEAGGTVYWALYAGGWKYATGPAIAKGSWQLITGLYNGTHVTLYYNTDAVGVATSSSGLITNCVGNDFSIGDSTPGNDWAGIIDEVVYLNRTLALADIRAIYHAGIDDLFIPQPVQTTVDASPVLALLSPLNGTVINITWMNITGTAVDSTNDSVFANDTAFVFHGSYQNWNFSASGLSNGVHTVRITANDTAGQETFIDIVFIVNVTAPVLYILSPSNGTITNSSWVNITGTASSFMPGSVWTNSSRFAVNRGNYSVWNFTGISLSGGVWSVMVFVNDTAGAVTADTVTFVVNLSVTDQNLSAVELLYPPYAEVSENVVVHAYVFADGYAIPNASVVIIIDGITAGMGWDSVSSAYAVIWIPSANGDYPFTVYAYGGNDMSASGLIKVRTPFNVTVRIWNNINMTAGSSYRNEFSWIYFTKDVDATLFTLFGRDLFACPPEGPSECYWHAAYRNGTATVTLYEPGNYTMYILGNNILWEMFNPIGATVPCAFCPPWKVQSRFLMNLGGYYLSSAEDFDLYYSSADLYVSGFTFGAFASWLTMAFFAIIAIVFFLVVLMATGSLKAAIAGMVILPTIIYLALNVLLW
jgi:hypothetical protein